jgi:TldD protein
VLLIWRAQARRTARVLLRRGRPEEISLTSSSGHGVQVFTPEGRTALGSRDEFRPETAVALFDRVLAAAVRGAALGLETASAVALSPARGSAIPDHLECFDRIDLQDVARRLAEVETEILARTPGITLHVGFSADLDAWRVMRSDGTDVLFAMPRSTLRVGASSEGAGQRHSVSASISRPDPRLLFEEEALSSLFRRAEKAALLATALPEAPSHPAGSFPLVIDYALAKGLAHEAFGHSSEADSFRSSVLARDGRFRVGDVVGASHVSIVDEPVPGDHAWQPYSANGEKRERVVIVDHGRLLDALADPWSAAEAGVRSTGASRAESFRSAPIPRMTNIRIEVDSPLPAPGRFEEYGPAEVRDLLASAGVLRRHPRVVFLSGYSGGQANPATGDFVFNCKAIYSISRDGVALHKPAIFSGSMVEALHAIREAFGPLLLDAIGTCGKWGQSVPSSGGSHYFLVLEPSPRVRLGGR